MGSTWLHLERTEAQRVGPEFVLAALEAEDNASSVLADFHGRR